MTYNPKTWQTKELITAEGLNHIEQGIKDSSTLADLNAVEGNIQGEHGYVKKIDINPSTGIGTITYYDGENKDQNLNSINFFTTEANWGDEQAQNLRDSIGAFSVQEGQNFIQDLFNDNFNSYFQEYFNNELSKNIDSELNSESLNLVQNKAISLALNNKINKTDIDNGLDSDNNSTNPISIKAFSEKINDIKTKIETIQTNTNENIQVEKNRINNIINNFNTVTQEEVLWDWLNDGSGGVAFQENRELTLSEHISHFDYIDVYSEFLSTENINTFKTPEDFDISNISSFDINQHLKTKKIWIRNSNIIDSINNPNSGGKTLSIAEIQLQLNNNPNNTNIKIYQNQRWTWNGTEGADAVWNNTGEGQDPTNDKLVIKKIIGRKLVKNLEVEDIREGYDGIVYDSAGDAVRNQIQNSNIAIKNYYFKNISLEMGTWSLDGITKGTSSNKRFRNQIKQFTKDIYSLTIPTGWEIYIFPLHGNILLAEPTWEEGTILISDLPENTDSFNFNIRKKGESQNDIQNYLENIQNSIKIVTTFEKELSSLQKETLKGYGTSNIDISTFISNYGTANTAPKQRIISISSNPSYNMMDYEFPVNVSGILTTLSKSSSTSSYTGTYQYFFTSDGRYFFRFGWSNFGKWKQFFSENAIDNPKITLGMFESIAVIGDSFASGSVGVNSQTNYALSWIQNIGRTYGIKATNYSKGGLTTRTWMTNSNGLPKLRADTGKLLYFIALGINDSNPDSRNVPIGVQTDFAIEENTPDTFYGNMGIIYREILAKNSAAIICWITIPRFDARYTPYSEAIRNMAEMTGMILIDSADVTLFKTNWWTNNLSSTAHPTAPMYNAMANAYAEKFSEVAINYMSLLNSYGGFINNNPSSSNNPEDPEV